MTGYQLIATRSPILRRLITKLSDWDSDEYGEIKTLFCFMAIAVALDGLFYVLWQVAIKFGLLG